MKKPKHPEIIRKYWREKQRTHRDRKKDSKNPE